MNTEMKEKLKESLDAYLKEQNISQNKFADMCGINSAYVSNIINGKNKIGNTEIADKYYKIIADNIGFQYKKEYWEPKPTDQLMRILATLEDARKNGYTNVIIGETGCGKSYACDLFQKKYPQDVFIIKLGESDKIGDVLDKTIIALNMPIRSNMKLEGGSQPRSRSHKIRRIIQYLIKLRRDGFDPTVIWDESEYMNIATLCAIKEFYDDLKKFAALILIGTDQLIEKLDRLKKNNKPGMPQFYSRIKFGIRELKPINGKYDILLDGVNDKSVRKFIKTNCDNYREVHDLLVPAMRESERLNVPLSIDLLNNMLGLD